METRVERLVAQLEKNMKHFPSDDRDKASSLLRWYATKGDLTEKQIKLGKAILGRKRKEVGYQKNEAPYFVYVISDGEFAKIGYSKNPKKRIKAVQTANPKRLKLVAKKEVQGRLRAKAIEKSLHKQYGKHRQVGEWFCGSILEELLKRFN